MKGLVKGQNGACHNIATLTQVHTVYRYSKSKRDRPDRVKLPENGSIKKVFFQSSTAESLLTFRFSLKIINCCPNVVSHYSKSKRTVYQNN